MKNRRHSQKAVSFVVLTALAFLIFVADAFSQTPAAKLSELRKQFAVKYLQPAAHFALAQYYLDKNDKLQAFLIMEYARRYRFAEKDFDAAFVKFFGDNSPEPGVEAKKAFEEGSRLLAAGNQNEAEKFLVEAAARAPKSGFIQGWVGRFYFKVKNDNEKALKYYFNAYFLDPHAYETEFVESRITNIAVAAADARFAELVKSGKSLIEISTDANAFVVGNAVGQMARQWKNEYVKPLLNCMGNDDSIVRWQTFQTLYNHAGASFDDTLTALTTDADLRKRGLAAYALVARRKEKSFDVLKKMLADEAELIRFDALSALILDGGAAELEIVETHRTTETNKTLREMIDKTLEKK